MDKKKILIVSASFYPQNSPRSFRTTELAKEFACQGHEVVVYIPFRGFDYSDYANEFHLQMKNLGVLSFKDTKLKGNRIEMLIRRGIKRVTELIFEYPDIELMFKVSNCLKHESEYDILISIAVPYPIHWGVAKVRSKEHKIADIWVADCGDPYMGCSTDSFKKPFYFKFIEKWFFRKCDYISIPFDALKEKFYQEFHDKIVIIPQGFRLDEIKLAEKVNNQVLTFAFAGSIIPGIRDLDLFFEFLKGINSEFKFYVYTQQPDYFIKFKRQFKERLEIRRYLPRLQLLYELSKYDFLINVDTIFDNQSLNTAFPSKLIDYSFTKRPILNICSNSINEEIIHEFIQGNYTRRREVNNDKYKIETVTARFLGLTDRMHRKRILIVSASFYPQNSPRSFRTTELAKEFARQGHEVVVYIPFRGFDYSDFGKKFHIQMENLGVLRYKGIKLKGNRLEMLVRRGIKRVTELIFEYPDIELMFKVSNRLKHRSRFDILISIAVPFPIHWGVAKVRSKMHKIADIWIADCGDPYMGDTTDSFRRIFYFKNVEKWFCQKANYITIPFEGARSAYYPEFQDKIRIIPQGFRLDNLNIPEFRKVLDYPVFAYAGGFIPGRRDPNVLLNFLSTCNRRFKFIVYTAQTGILLPFKKSLEEKLEIREIVPREKLLIILSGMDFLINFDNNTHTQLPSKLIDYSISGRPVINITSESDFSSFVEFMDGNYSRRMNLEPTINYDIKVVTEKFIHLHATV
jgi:hypothetical protein